MPSYKLYNCKSFLIWLQATNSPISEKQINNVLDIEVEAKIASIWLHVLLVWYEITVDPMIYTRVVP